MYTPLYIKTNNSLLTSLIKIDELVSYALNNNINTLTITDNNMYGVMDFYNACISNNIKPVIGIELTLNSPFVLYCKTNKGYQNIIKLITIKDVAIDDLKKYSEDLICIVPYDSLKDYSALESIYQDIYIGYKSIEERSSLKTNNLVYMNEILCLNSNETNYLKYLKGIKELNTFDNIKDDFSDNYLKLYEEITKLDLENNKKIIDSCNVRINKNEGMIPKFDCPDGLDSFSYLKKLCMEGLRRIFGKSAPLKYVERLKYELNIINKMGFNDYFLIVADIIRYAKESGILVAPGRGSAAGSLVSYCLDIITIDPIEYDLYFERFLNPDRINMPDIDTDLEDNRRQEVIDYCILKYGSKRVVPIIAFGTLKSKQAVRDIGRVMNISSEAIDKICRYLDSNLTLQDNLRKNQKLSNFLQVDSKLQQLYRVAIKIEGLRRHTTIHAAGVIISSRDLDEVIPLVKHGDNYLTSYSMEHLENLGLLKMDFLAISNLTIINNIIKQIDNNLNFNNIPLNDIKTINLFKNAKTLGIFQFESKGMRDTLSKFKVESLEEIIAVIALYRPGPMDNIPLYIKRKNKQERIDYIDDTLKEVLESTYGIIIYQEQIMRIANIMASYSMSEADLLRKAMSKKKEDILIKEKEKFISRSIKNGYTKETSKKVYDLIFKFASYGFNRAHSVAYAIVAYKMAYLKANYPLIFSVNLLTMYQGSEEKTKAYITECKQNNISFLTPDINYSSYNYKIEDNSIRYPLTIIKGISKNVVASIEEVRGGIPFTDIYDFFSRIHNKKINKKNIETLIYAGAFDSFEYNQKTIINNLDKLLNYGELSAIIDDNYALKPEIDIEDEYPLKEKIEKELSLYGFYISNHPVSSKKSKYNDYINLDKVNTMFNKMINVIVMIDYTKEIMTKKHEEMAFYKVSDEFSNISLTLFPEKYKEYKKYTKGNIVKVSGRVERRFDEFQIIVDTMTKI